LNKLINYWRRFIDGRQGLEKILRLYFILTAASCFLLVVTLPLDLNQQVIFGLTSFVAVLVLRNMPWSRLEVLAMIVLSVTASLRYMYWRLTDTVDFDNMVDAFFGWGLVLAEIYTLCILLLGYIQTAWPLERKAVNLPAELEKWPMVDVFIPTYNEPLNIVQ